MNSPSAVLGLICLLAIGFSTNAQLGIQIPGVPGLQVPGVQVPDVQVPSIQVPGVSLPGVGVNVGGLGLDVGGLGLGLGGPGGALGGLLDLSGSAGLLSGNNSVQAQLGKEIANATIELVRHTVTVIGIIVASVQQILDGICSILFDLYTGFLYPILDCLFGILGIMDAICVISYEPCTYNLLAQVASGNQSEMIGITSGDQEPVQIGAGAPGSDEPEKPVKARRKRGEDPPKPSTEAPSTNVTEADAIGSFLDGFSGEDRKFAVLTLRFVALVIQITIYLSVHLHLLPIIFCVDLRVELGFDQASVACGAVSGKGAKEGGEGGEEEGGGGLLGGLIGGK